MDRDIETATNAESRIKFLVQSRRDHYARVFDAIVEEERELSALYEPVKERLASEDGLLAKLSVSIRRSLRAIRILFHLDPTATEKRGPRARFLHGAGHLPAVTNFRRYLVINRPHFSITNG